MTNIELLWRTIVRFVFLFIALLTPVAGAVGVFMLTDHLTGSTIFSGLTGIVAGAIGFIVLKVSLEDVQKEMEDEGK